MNQTIRLAQVSSVGRSNFSSDAQSPFHSSMSGALLGQGEDEYNRAITQVQRYDALVARAQAIIDTAARNTILAQFYGPTSNHDAAHYEREKLNGYITDAQAGTPPTGMNPITPPDTRWFTFNRVVNSRERLESYNDDFDAAVVNAERTYGTTGQTTPTPTPTGTTTTTVVPFDWKPVLYIGGGALALALLVSLVAGKKG